jgi:hypothetical protein
LIKEHKNEKIIRLKLVTVLHMIQGILLHYVHRLNTKQKDRMLNFVRKANEFIENTGCDKFNHMTEVITRYLINNR